MDRDFAPHLNPQTVARFAADWAALAPSGSAGLAVSGGPDSLALLLLAHAALPSGTFAVATVDHGLRPEAAAEAAMVARLCARLAVPHTTITLALPPGSAVQERARTARYAALAAWLREQGLSALATAHHADDQAELLVMRLNRGAGLRGLAGMRACAPLPGAPEWPLLRPLLGWRRAELVALVAEAGLAAADDPSNRDPRFERVRIRDALAAAPWLNAAALAASAAHLADADVALDWAADRAWQTVEPDRTGLRWTAEGPRAVRLRVLERIVARLGRSVPRGSDLAGWLDRIEAGGIATLAGVRGNGRAVPWRFAAVPPRRSPPG